MLAAFHGWHYRSSFVANLSFMGYNKGLEGRTTHDWLNREQGKGVRRAIQSLKDAGVQNIESIFYPGARHELLLETNKQEVFADIANWLDKRLTKQ